MIGLGRILYNTWIMELNISRTAPTSQVFLHNAGNRGVNPGRLLFICAISSEYARNFMYKFMNVAHRSCYIPAKLSGLHMLVEKWIFDDFS
jgi:hypothetical protein